METFSALLAICAGNSPVPGEFPTQRPVTQSFDVFFDLRLNKRLSKQWWGWWFETPASSLWRHCNIIINSRRSKLTGCSAVARAKRQSYFRLFSNFPRRDLAEDIMDPVQFQGPFSDSPKGNHSSIGFMVRISNYIHIDLWDVITHPCLNVNGALAKGHW